MVNKFYNVVCNLLLTLIFIIYIPVVSAANVVASIDRNPVVLGESFQLILSIDQGSSDGEPELRVLNNDFEIISRSQSSNIQIINGSMSRNMQYIITLMPKRAGKLNIPAIQIGSKRSQPMVLTVKTQTVGKQASNDVFLEMTANKSESIIQAQIILTVSLFRSVNLVNASLSLPKIGTGEAIIESLGEGREFKIQQNGVTFHVNERKYAIFPQKSGVLIIDPIQFNGQIVHTSGRFINNPLFGNMRNLQNKRLHSKPVKINVSAAPVTQGNKSWLPARSISLTETWQDTPPVFKVGEAVTRTITLTADGLMSAQLTAIKIEMPQGIKYYSDQIKTSDKRLPSGIIGSQQQKIAIIPAQEGVYTLPEIRLEWWNTKTRRIELIKLPKRIIHVLSAEPVLLTSGHDMTALIKGNSIHDEIDSVNDNQLLHVLSETGIWPWISLCLLIGWLMTVIMMRSKNKSTGMIDVIFNDNSISKREALIKLKACCFSNDPLAIKKALLSWSKVQFPDKFITSLADISTCCNKEIGAEIMLLSKSLYSNDRAVWNGKNIWQEIKLYLKNNGKAIKDKEQYLLPLYTN